MGEITRLSTKAPLWPLPWRPVALGAAAAVLVMGLGGAATEIGPWYEALIKPSWNPPNWVFGPAWTLIFALTALAGVNAWLRAPSLDQRRLVLVAYAANGLLNVGWSELFFHLKRPDWASIEVVFLWLSVLAILVISGRIHRPCGWLLAPYLAWVAFAAFLNVTIVSINPPFGE